jgi:hypothetical protein
MARTAYGVSMGLRYRLICCVMIASSIAFGAGPAAAAARARQPLPTYNCHIDPNVGRASNDVCYRVRRGDWLWKIARARPFAGPATPIDVPVTAHLLRLRVEELYRQNRDVIGPNPNGLVPGTELTVGTVDI